MVTELNALKQAVAALTTKTDGLQTDVTNIKTDVGTIETTIAGMGGGSEPWENVTDVFVGHTTIGTGGFVAGKDVYMMCLPTAFDIGSADPSNTYVSYYNQYGSCQINGIIMTQSRKDTVYLPMGVKFKFYASNDDSDNMLIIYNAMVIIYSK